MRVSGLDSTTMRTGGVKLPVAGNCGMLKGSGQRVRVSGLESTTMRAGGVTLPVAETCFWARAAQLKKWKLEADDTTLLDLLPFLEAVVRTNVPDVRKARTPPSAVHPLAVLASAPVERHGGSPLGGAQSIAVASWLAAKHDGDVLHGRLHTLPYSYPYITLDVMQLCAGRPQVVASYDGEEDVTAAFRARMQQLQAAQAAQKQKRRGLLGGLGS